MASIERDQSGAAQTTKSVGRQRYEIILTSTLRAAIKLIPVAGSSLDQLLFGTIEQLKKHEDERKKEDDQVQRRHNEEETATLLRELYSEVLALRAYDRRHELTSADPGVLAAAIVEANTSTGQTLVAKLGVMGDNKFLHLIGLLDILDDLASSILSTDREINELVSQGVTNKLNNGRINQLYTNDVLTRNV